LTLSSNWDRGNQSLKGLLRLFLRKNEISILREQEAGTPLAGYLNAMGRESNLTA
jgi:hypothetical protein